jgi:2-polyprenyl-6-methoxyphenol hydroxylase-like FAD-dependent oxidoreductase
LSKPTTRLTGGAGGFFGPSPCRARRGPGVASRRTLRDALLAGLNAQTRDPADVVQWGRAVPGYDRDAAGRLRVRCADGTDLAADLLVGPDGSNSRIRRVRGGETSTVGPESLGRRTRPVSALLSRAQ